MKDTNSQQFINTVIADEESVISKLHLRERLKRTVVEESKLFRFASAFYHIRVGFVRLNFIIGARCPTNEMYWSGLAKNLMEELGGERGPSHNELYRWFLKEVGCPDESKLECPPFAAKFDKKWEKYCRQAPLIDVLGAIAVYEIFDNPDYQMLYDTMKQANVGKRGLVFFGVHANAHHFELFETFYERVSSTQAGRNALKRARVFVIQTQREMWHGLLAYLETDDRVLA